MRRGLSAQGGFCGVQSTAQITAENLNISPQNEKARWSTELKKNRLDFSKRLLYGGLFGGCAFSHISFNPKVRSSTFSTSNNPLIL